MAINHVQTLAFLPFSGSTGGIGLCIGRLSISLSFFFLLLVDLDELVSFFSLTMFPSVCYYSVCSISYNSKFIMSFISFICLDRVHEYKGNNYVCIHYIYDCLWKQSLLIITYCVFDKDIFFFPSRLKWNIEHGRLYRLH